MYKNKTIGIWGLGKVGMSVAHFLHAQGAHIIGMDKVSLSNHDGIIRELFTQDQKDLFFANADYILASPGIDIRPYYQQHKAKWITELDLFYQSWQKPIIAITGSVGKTTVTTLLGQLLNKYGVKVVVGGNIGNPMLTMIKTDADIALLEVSSFQLEYCSSFAPDLALWTNFVPNHLDRHTLAEYFTAKTQILRHQEGSQSTIIPYDLLSPLTALFPERTFQVIIENNAISLEQQKALLQDGHTILTIQSNIFSTHTQHAHHELIDITLLPSTTFLSNWLVIIATLHKLGLDLTLLPSIATSTIIPAHRMEKITREKIVFYNDSKATTPTSTLSAIQCLTGQSIVLFLGGLSKGLDRSDLVRALQKKVTRIYCFGKEAATLHHWCNTYAIPSSAHDTLDEAFYLCMQNKKEQDIILFSPAGSSYDLFKDYEERGNHFKQLITNYFKL